MVLRHEQRRAFVRQPCAEGAVSRTAGPRPQPAATRALPSQLVRYERGATATVAAEYRPKHEPFGPCLTTRTFPPTGRSTPGLRVRYLAVILLHCVSAACLSELSGIFAAAERQVCFALLAAAFTFALFVVI